MVEISAEPTPSRSAEKAPTLPRDASLACRRAKSVVTKDDVGEYDKVNTDIVKVAGVHSLMKVCSFLFLAHIFVMLYVFSGFDHLFSHVGPD